MSRLAKVLSVTALLLTSAAPVLAFEDGKPVIRTGQKDAVVSISVAAIQSGLPVTVVLRFAQRYPVSGRGDAAVKG